MLMVPASCISSYHDILTVGIYACVVMWYWQEHTAQGDLCSLHVFMFNNHVNVQASFQVHIQFISSSVISSFSIHVQSHFLVKSCCVHVQSCIAFTFIPTLVMLFIKYTMHTHVHFMMYPCTLLPYMHMYTDISLAVYLLRFVIKYHLVVPTIIFS